MPACLYACWPYRLTLIPITAVFVWPCNIHVPRYRFAILQLKKVYQLIAGGVLFLCCHFKWLRGFHFFFCCFIFDDDEQVGRALVTDAPVHAPFKSSPHRT